MAKLGTDLTATTLQIWTMDLDDPLPGPSREIPTSTTSGGARRRTTRSKKRRSTTNTDAVATESRRSRMPKTSKRSRYIY